MSSRKSGSNGIGKLVGVKGPMPTNSDDITGPKIERYHLLWALANRCFEEEDTEADMESTVNSIISEFPDQQERIYDACLLYAKYLLRRDDFSGAEEWSQKAKAIRGLSLEAKEILESVRNARFPAWHFRMLNDRNRNDAYRRAIRSLIAAGNGDIKRVIDIGAGTGLLSMYAAGSSPAVSEVVAVEANTDMAKLAAEIVAMNDDGDDIAGNWSERICVLPRLSTSLKDSAKFDLLITETFDAGLFGEHIAETLDHAHKKLLHNNSKIIPRGAKVFAGLLECGFLERQHSFTSNSCGPLDFSALRLESTMPREYLATVNYTKLMECYDPYDTIDLPNMPPDQFKIVSDPVQIGDVFDFEDSDQVARWLGERTSYRNRLTANQAGRVCAVAIWFELDLGIDGITINTSPTGSEKTSWEQAVFPLRYPVNLEAGDQVDVELDLQGHFTMSKFEPVSKVGEHGKTSLPVPKEFLTTMNDTKLMEFYDRIAQRLQTRGKVRVLDATRCGGLISLFAMKHANRDNSGGIETTFLIPSDGPHEGVKNLLNFIEEVSRSNGINMSNISFLGEAALEEDEAGNEYDLVFGDPISMEHSGTDASALARMARIEGDLAKTVLPSSLSIRCHFVNSDKLISASKLISDDNVHGLKISEVINRYRRYSIGRMRESGLGYMRRVSEVWSGPRLTMAELAEAEKTFEAELAFESTCVAHGIRLDFVLNYDIGDVVIDTAAHGHESGGSFCNMILVLPESIAIRKPGEEKAKIKIVCEGGLVDVEFIELSSKT